MDILHGTMVGQAQYIDDIDSCVWAEEVLSIYLDSL